MTPGAPPTRAPDAVAPASAAALRFAVIGQPVAHSRSPAMHGAALRALGLPHTYDALPTTDAEVAARVQALRDGTLSGLNVTLPHKTRVLALADVIAPSARATGAANTLVRRTAAGAQGGAQIVAHNTDAPALALELVELAGHPAQAGFWASTRALVLGSGGAARAAVAALASLGVTDVVVRCRRDDAGFTLAPGLPSSQPWAPDRSSEARTGVVLQTTSAGMTGADPGEAVAAVVAWDALPPSCVALDVVYAPPETPFLAAAAGRGLRTRGGLGMLARQGALAFELWTGIAPPLDVMLASLASPTAATRTAAPGAGA